MLYKFSSLDNYQDSIHYRDSFTATIMIVKFLLSLSATKRLRKTRKYKQQAKYDLLFTSPARIRMVAVNLKCVEPVTMSTIKIILRYYSDVAT